MFNLTVYATSDDIFNLINHQYLDVLHIYLPETLFTSVKRYCFEDKMITWNYILSHPIRINLLYIISIKYILSAFLESSGTLNFCFYIGNWELQTIVCQQTQASTSSSQAVIEGGEGYVGHAGYGVTFPHAFGIFFHLLRHITTPIWIVCHDRLLEICLPNLMLRYSIFDTPKTGASCIMLIIY